VPTSGRSVLLPLVVVFAYLLMAFLLRGFKQQVPTSADSPGY